jgi:hypothetical protein
MSLLVPVLAEHVTLTATRPRGHPAATFGDATDGQE